MKITFGRIFETSLVGKTKAYEELQPFIDWIQSAIDNMARALTSQLSVSDNLDASFISQTARSTSTAVTLEFKAPKRPQALMLASAPVSPKVTSWGWQVLVNGNVQVSLVFDAAPATGADLRFLAFYS